MLSVKINIPDGVLHHLMKFCDRNWVFKGISYALRKRLIEQSVKDSYTRLSKFMNAQYVSFKKINFYLEWSLLWTLLGYQKGM